MYSVSVAEAEAVVTIIVCDFFQSKYVYCLRFNVFKSDPLKDMLTIKKDRSMPMYPIPVG